MGRHSSAKSRSGLALVLVFAVTLLGLAPASSSASVVAQDPGPRVNTTSSKVASPSQPEVTQGDLVRLSLRLRTVIRAVEKTELSCDLKNTLVRRLRLVDDGLRSGRPSSAAGLLAAWISRVEAIAAANALSPPLADRLRSQLPLIQDKLGVGWRKDPKPVRNWPELPTCDKTGGAPVAGESYEVWNAGDAEIVVRAALEMVPGVGALLAGLAGVFWPRDSADLYTLIDQIENVSAQQIAKTALQSLQQAIYDFNWLENEQWYQHCVLTITEPNCTSDKQALVQSYDTWVEKFRDSGVAFQQDPALHDDLLPMYAQYENMYLSLLREGLLYGGQWGVNATSMAKYRKYLQEELDTTGTGRGIGYVDAVDTANRPDAGNDWAEWKAWNAYERKMELEVRDFRRLWPYMDPEKYPNGYPGLTQTRMILSDPVGCYNVYPKAPVNPEGLGMIRYFQVWEDNDTAELTGFDIIDAIQVYASGLPTPPPIMGDDTPDGNTLYWSLGNWPRAYIDRIHYGEGETVATLDKKRFPQGLTFHFNDGSTASLGSYANIFLTSQVHEGDFAYEDHILANARIAGIHTWQYTDSTANCLVFGFRLVDSY